MVEGGVGAVVPGAAAEFAQLDAVDGFYFGDLLVGEQGGGVHTVVLAVLGVLFVAAAFLAFLEFVVLVVEFLVGLGNRAVGTLRMRE